MAKIQNLDFRSHRTIEVVFDDSDPENPRTLTARIRGLPIDTGEMLMERLTAPQPPRRPLRDKRGPIKENGRVVIQEDLNDPTYQAQKRVHDRRSAVAMLMEALDDPTWEFDAVRPADDAPEEEWKTYYDAVWTELKETGLPLAAFTSLMKQISEDLNVTDKDIEDATQSF